MFGKEGLVARTFNMLQERAVDRFSIGQYKAEYDPLGQGEGGSGYRGFVFSLGSLF